MTQLEKLYAERDASELDEAGNYYIKHVIAMTAEQLHSKSAIAAELAHRDMLIDKLTEELQAAKAQAVPDGYTLISTEILDRFPEINLSNYGPDEVDALNAWGIEVVTASVPVKEVI